MFSRLFAAELRVQGSAIWPSPRRMPVLFSLLLGVCLWMLLLYAHQLAAKETISPKVEAAMKFVRANPGKRAIITSLSKALDALDGKTGTQITFA